MPGCDRAATEPLLSWLTLLGSVLVNTFLMMPIYLIPLYFQSLVKHFDTSMQAVGWAKSIFYVTLISQGSITCLLVRWYSCRQVSLAAALLCSVGVSLSTLAPNFPVFIVTYSICGGIGVGHLMFTARNVVQLHFHTNRGLATGVALLGLSLGTICVPIILQFFIVQYGLQGALLLSGAVVAHTVVGSCLYFPPPPPPTSRKHSQVDEEEIQEISSFLEILLEEQDTTTGSPTVIDDEDESLTHAKSKLELKPYEKRNLVQLACGRLKLWCGEMSVLLRNPLLGLICLTEVGSHFNEETITTTAPSFYARCGVPPMEVAFLMSLVGMVNTPVRVLILPLMNWSRLNVIVLYAFGIASGGVATAAIMFGQQYGWFLTGMVAFGIYEGIVNTTRDLCLVKIVGVKQFLVAMTVFCYCDVPLSLTAAPLLGWMVDQWGTYMYGFYLALTCSLLSISSMVAMIITHRRSQQKNLRLTDLPKAQLA